MLEVVKNWRQFNLAILNYFCSNLHCELHLTSQLFFFQVSLTVNCTLHSPIYTVNCTFQVSLTQLFKWLITFLNDMFLPESLLLCSFFFLTLVIVVSYNRFVPYYDGMTTKMNQLLLSAQMSLGEVMPFAQ